MLVHIEAVRRAGCAPIDEHPKAHRLPSPSRTRPIDCSTPSTAPKATGWGIGLSLRWSIVDSHHGRLWVVANEDGPGATFTFTVPCGITAAPTISA